MQLVCLDLEGVLVPEIWVAFAKASNIKELELTTRDEPDYDKLMNYRLDVLRQHTMGLTEIQQVIETIDPLPGAKEFLDELREEAEVVILSDTFVQFAKPLMKKLNYPTLICNDLIIGTGGEITGYKMRCKETKLTTINAFHTAGIETIAAGDSFNDLGMIQASQAGFLFRTTEAIQADFPHIPAFTEYHELLTAIEGVLD